MKHIINMLLVGWVFWSGFATAETESLFTTTPALHKPYLEGKVNQNHGIKNEYVSAQAAMGYQFHPFLSLETGTLIINEHGNLEDEANIKFYGIDLALRAGVPLSEHVTLYAKMGPAMNMTKACTASECHRQSLGTSAYFAGGSTFFLTQQLTLDADIGANSFLTSPGRNTVFESDLALRYHFR